MSRCRVLNGPVKVAPRGHAQHLATLAPGNGQSSRMDGAILVFDCFGQVQRRLVHFCIHGCGSPKRCSSTCGFGSAWPRSRPPVAGWWTVCTCRPVGSSTSELGTRVVLDRGELSGWESGLWLSGSGTAVR